MKCYLCPRVCVCVSLSVCVCVCPSPLLNLLTMSQLHVWVTEEGGFTFFLYSEKRTLVRPMQLDLAKSGPKSFMHLGQGVGGISRQITSVLSHILFDYVDKLSYFRLLKKLSWKKHSFHG